MKGSTAYNLAGWIPEGAWIALILGLLVLSAVGTAKRKALLVRQQEAAAEAARQRAEVVRRQEVAARQQAAVEQARMRQERAAEAEAKVARDLAALKLEREQHLALAEERARMRLVDTPWYDPEARHHTHSTCTIQHRSEGSALRCKSTV